MLYGDVLCIFLVRAPLRLWLEQLELWVHLDFLSLLVVDELDAMRQPFLYVGVVYLASRVSGTLRPHQVGWVLVELCLHVLKVVVFTLRINWLGGIPGPLLAAKCSIAARRPCLEIEPGLAGLAQNIQLALLLVCWGATPHQVLLARSAAIALIS